MAYNRRKRKVKKNIPEAQAHIHATYNNTVVSITDVVGLLLVLLVIRVQRRKLLMLLV